MSSYAYSYCFLRYRRDPDAGEFANIGVALWSPSCRFLAFQGCDRYSRLTSFFGGLDRDGYRRIIGHVERSFDALSLRFQHDLLPENSSQTVRDIAFTVVPNDDGSLVWGPSRGGFTEDPSGEISRLFERYIAQYNRKEEKPRRDDSQVFRDVYRPAFLSQPVADVLTSHEVIAPLARHCFNYAWKNGVWNVYETLSLDMSEPESIERKAHTWYGRSMHLAESSEKPVIHYLLGRPADGEDRLEAYELAKQILCSAPHVQLVEEHDVQSFALRLANQVSKTA